MSNGFCGRTRGETSAPPCLLLLLGRLRMRERLARRQPDKAAEILVVEPRRREIGGRLGARGRHVYLDIARKIAIPNDPLETPEHPQTLGVRELAFEAVRRRPGERGRYDRIEQRQIGTPQVQRPSHVLRIARNDRTVEIDRRPARTRVDGQQVRIAFAPQRNQALAPPFQLHGLAAQLAATAKAQRRRLAFGRLRLQTHAEVGAKRGIAIADDATIDVDRGDRRPQRSAVDIEMPVGRAFGVPFEQHVRLHELHVVGLPLQ